MYQAMKAANKALDLAAKTIEADAIAVFVLGKPCRLAACYKSLDKLMGGAVTKHLARSEFSCNVGEVATVYPESGVERAFVVGVGAKDSFHTNDLRIAAKNLAKVANACGIKKLAIAGAGTFAKHFDAETFGTTIAEGMGLACFTFEEFKGKASESDKKRKTSVINVVVEAGVRKGFGRAVMINDGVNTAKRLAATPPNVANVGYIEKYCKAMAKKVGLKCSTINATKAKQLGMGGLLAVGAGSKSQPALIVMEWSGNDPKSQPDLIVGKSITFDTGGYSLKPDGGKNMKYDKCGGMTVIGIMEAIAKLKIKQRVVGIVAAAENMIDANAYRVDDIIKFYNGVTCEITNTDAEGRLVLADALAYGTSKYQPKSVVDLATLTGGVVVALGSFCAGVFATDEKMLTQMQNAADSTGEKVWALPLWNEHRKQMQGMHADLVNSANREAHPIQGAAFLSYFVGENAPKQMPKIPWMHIDIAGVASFDSETLLYAKGPSGWGVRLVTEYLSKR